MKEHPILFSGPMILAIIKGRKTRAVGQHQRRPSPVGLQPVGVGRDVSEDRIMKPILVWCGVDPKGQVMPTAIGTTRESAWWALVCSAPAEVQNPKQAKAAGFTVRRFRLEEVPK